MDFIEYFDAIWLALREPDFLAIVFSISLAAKVFANSSIEIFTKKRLKHWVQHLIFLCYFYLAWQTPLVGLGIAIVLRVVYLIKFQLIATPNHPFLELLLLIVCFSFLFQKSHVAGGILISFLQIAICSVWIYSAVHKATNKQYNSGLFIYCFLAFSNKKHWSQKLIIPRWFSSEQVNYNYGEMHRKKHQIATVISWFLVLFEVFVPIYCIIYSGNIQAVIIMMGLSTLIGLMSGEWSFLYSNLLISLLFLVPFNSESLIISLHFTTHAIIGLWLLVWPLLHNVLYRWLVFSPWRLFGWGMYSMIDPSVRVVSEDGVLHRLRTRNHREIVSSVLMRGFGMTKVAWLRKISHRYCDKCSVINETIVAFQMQTIHQKNNRFFTEVTIVPNSHRLNLHSRSVYIIRNSTDNELLSEWRTQQILQIKSAHLLSENLKV